MTGRNWRLLPLILLLSLLSAVAHSDATAATVARERFALRLASSLGLSQPRSNVAVSPLLLHSALTLLYAGVGVNAQTVQQQLRVALELQQLGTPEQALHMFEQLLAQLKQSAAVGCQLRLLSDFYTARSFMFNFRDEFLARTERLGFGVHRLDFGNVPSATQSINYEFLTRSNYSVGELVSSSLLEAAQHTPFLHVSALTFHAPWAQGFDPRETQRLQFFSDAQNHKLVESMFVQHSFRYAELPQLDACAVELPYATAGLSLLIIYPNQLEGLAEVERKLQSVDLQQLRSQLEERKLALTLPKFSLLAHTELRHILEQVSGRWIHIPSNSLSFTLFAAGPGQALHCGGTTS